VKENCQITINGLTKHQNTNFHTIKNNRGTEKQHFLEQISPLHGPELVCEPAILAPKNSNVNNINLNL
jgi:hypothetical protein